MVMTRCQTSETCNYPEGECAGLCLHRLLRPVEQRMPIEFAGPEPEPEDEVKEGRFSAAWDAYKTHRALGRIRALRIAVRRAWRN
jgi:hypothetical protein